MNAMLTAVPLAARVALLTPIWAAHRLYSEVRVRRSTGSRTDIRRVSAHDIDLDSVISSDEPVIIEGLVDQLQLPLVPDLDGLRALARRRTARFPVTSHKRSAPYFLYVGDYGAEPARTDDMTLAEFLDFMFDDREGRDPETCTYHLFDVDDLEGEVGTIIDSLADGLARLTDRVPDPSASGIWIGSTGVVTPLHHDAWTGLLFQLTGSKRVLMFPPVERPNLSFTSPFAATDRWSLLPARSAEADPKTFPRFARADGYVARLEAGDVLFIPPFWSHEIEALESNISIPFRFGTQWIDQLNPGFLRPAYEQLHRRYGVPVRSR
jgi:hypothetical protein